MQLLTVYLVQLTEAQVRAIIDQLRATEQPESGLLREFAMRDQRDPTSIYVLALFESEERSRVREQDPRRQEGLRTLQAMMAEVFTSPPEFVDLEVLDEITLPSSQP